VPADFIIDVSRRVVFTKGMGPLTPADSIDHQTRLLADPDFRPHFNHLIDFRDVSTVSLTGADIAILARRSVFSPGSRRAFVVVADLHFGLARMFEVYRDDAGEQNVGVFRDVDSAMQWVGVASLPEPEAFPRLRGDLKKTVEGS
jgi:hypothetical protein